jgi:hypothetical protein
MILRLEPGEQKSLHIELEAERRDPADAVSLGIAPTSANSALGKHRPPGRSILDCSHPVGDPEEIHADLEGVGLQGERGQHHAAALVLTQRLSLRKGVEHVAPYLGRAEHTTGRSQNLLSTLKDRNTSHWRMILIAARHAELLTWPLVPAPTLNI